MEFNQDKVRKITSEILRSLERLGELKSLPQDVFLSDHHKIGSARYNFIVAIEGMIDLCNHIIAKNSFRTLKVMLIRSEFWKNEVLLMKNLPIY